jgi:hypothetical protein
MNIWALSQPPSIGCPTCPAGRGSFASFAKGGIRDRPQTTPRRFCSLGEVKDGMNAAFQTLSQPPLSQICRLDRSSPGFSTTRCWRARRVRLAVKASRMNFINATGLNRKSGGAQWRNLRFPHPPRCFPSLSFSPRRAPSSRTSAQTGCSLRVVTQ